MRLLPTFSALIAPALICVSAFGADAPKSAYPPHAIERSELRVLPKKPGSDRQYQLHVGLPESYAKNPNKKYPVVYVTDGYWDFQKITAIHGALLYDKVIPEFITVGLGYAGEDLNYGQLRGWDLAPVAWNNNPKTGHGAEYLQMIKNEVIPFIEKEYRADPSFRVMAGASLGGLFTLYSMYAEPGLFQGYVAATPAVIVGNDWLLGFEEEFAKSGKTLKGRLYVTGGGNESPGFLGGILRYNARVSSRHYKDLAYEFRIIDGERHSGMQLETYNRGLRFVFQPLAPESGPATVP